MKIRKVLVSQQQPEANSPYFEIAKKYNVKIDFRPFIKVDPILAKEFRQQHINIADYNAFVFNSCHGIDNFFRLAAEMRVRIDPEWHYFCTSEKIANYLQKYIEYRKRKVHYGSSILAKDLFPVIMRVNEVRTLKYLIVLPAEYKSDIPEWFDQNELPHDIGMMYRTVSNDFDSNEQIDYDVFLFFSPHGIKSLKQNFPNFEQGEIVIGCAGKGTADAIRDAGFRLDFEVPSETYKSMTEALESFVKERNKRR